METTKKAPKVVIIMGATGAGKSKLAIDLASYFPVEIINADSMQVYKGLDVLTNKVPLHQQKGVSHHLLGTITPDVEFTSKDFRDSAIQIIDDIISRDKLPVIVGGTNYYIQALVTPFLLDDLVEELDDCCLKDPIGHSDLDHNFVMGNEDTSLDYECLKKLDPDATNRIHPNDYRKINQYLRLYTRTGVPPSKIYQGKASKKWGRADNCRYDCCFVCVDASLPVLDQYVEERVDCMINTGLLDEVYNIYSLNADYTKGLRQAIGVREFEEFLKVYLSKDYSDEGVTISTANDRLLGETVKAILESKDNCYKVLLIEAIDRLKTNTKRLVRRQKRRLNRLQTLFSWDMHFVDATQSLSSNSFDSWLIQVVEPSVDIIRSFLSKEECAFSDSKILSVVASKTLDKRDLWTKHVCEPCGNRILRGAYEWEQHKQGRGHRKRISGLKKSKQYLVERAAAPVGKDVHMHV